MLDDTGNNLVLRSLLAPLYFPRVSYDVSLDTRSAHHVVTGKDLNPVHGSVFFDQRDVPAL